MTPNEALAIVAAKAAGRTRYEGQEPALDEVLAAEVMRLRALVERMASEIALNADEKWPHRDQYQHQAAKHYLDMAIVREARSAVRGAW